jgi:cellulose biosynthesis protein BcsQ
VGKSTLSYLVARALAEEGEVALVDADLTGTSLADVLPLRPPRWTELDAGGLLPLHREPDSWGEVDRKGEHLRSRASTEDGYRRSVPLLNDFLLWSEDRYNSEGDVHPRALFWKLPEGDPLAENLFILPSSALPNDLSHILPLIYDELHAAYLESRLEWLLHFILLKTNVRTVVFDTPPTIPGLSRAVLSMAMRLPDYVDLAEDKGTPLELTRKRTERIDWDPFLVVTTDLQDLRAADRWLEGRDPAETNRIHVVLNRTENEWKDIGLKLRKALSGVESSDVDAVESGVLDFYSGALLKDERVTILDKNALRVFREGSNPQDKFAEIEPLLSLLRRGSK